MPLRVKNDPNFKNIENPKESRKSWSLEFEMPEIRYFNS